MDGEKELKKERGGEEARANSVNDRLGDGVQNRANEWKETQKFTTDHLTTRHRKIGGERVSGIEATGGIKPSAKRDDWNASRVVSGALPETSKEKQQRIGSRDGRIGWRSSKRTRGGFHYHR